MNNKNRYLTCKRVVYYSQLDEDAFFEWLKKINCIINIEGALDELYLDLKDGDLTYEDLSNLIAIFHRYKIDMKQLAEFVNKDNMDAALPWKKEIGLKKNGQRDL